MFTKRAFLGCLSRLFCTGLSLLSFPGNVVALQIIDVKLSDKLCKVIYLDSP